MKTAMTRLGTCFAIALVVLLIDCSICYSQYTPMVDVIYLKNGSVVRGMIIEQVPGKSMTIRTLDGIVFTLTIKEIEKLTKERPSLESNRQRTAYGKRKTGNKSGFGSCLLSLMVPGAGQLYNDEGRKGAIMFGMFVAGYAIASVAVGHRSTDYYGHRETYNHEVATIGVVLLMGSYIWSIIDAPISSARINRENGFTSVKDVSDKLYVDVKMRTLGDKPTPFLNAALSF